jgi:type 1 fimbria pilin
MKSFFIYGLALLFIISLLGCSPYGSNKGKVQNSTSNVNSVTNGAVDISSNKAGIAGYVMNKKDGKILVVNPDVQDFSSTGGVKEHYSAIRFSNCSSRD